MSVLVVGVSHRTAPVDLLERLALDDDGARKLRVAALDTPHVVEALVLATCNRVEIYAEVDRFHGSVEDLTGLLVERAGVDADQVIPSLYVHYDTGAVGHLFSVAAGLKSMVVGEGQILGQVRESLRLAQEDESVGTALNTLFQQGLRVGKRAHSETGIDRAGQSVVSVALHEAASVLSDLGKARVCVVGSGSIAALAAASVRKAGISSLVVVSRTLENAQRLAARVDARSAPMSELAPELAAADLVISCTGATGVVVPTSVVTSALQSGRPGRQVAVIDLALPHDVAPEVADLPGATLISLKRLSESVHEGDSAAADVAAVEAIVTEEVGAYGAAREAARVTPTVVALRSMATDVVGSELDRLWGRVEDLTPEQRAEIAHTMRRLADKLLHEPTVRIKEFAGRTPESSYADALAELFALDQSAVDAVTGGENT
ncbi:MAG: glutamyl-tRNA reductase [Nocardioidaceae bacterium]